MTNIAALHQRLLENLAASGKLTPHWRDAFAAVARHQFIPRRDEATVNHFLHVERLVSPTTMGGLSLITVVIVAVGQR